MLICGIGSVFVSFQAHKSPACQREHDSAHSNDQDTFSIYISPPFTALSLWVGGGGGRGGGGGGKNAMVKTH